jgi:TRAP-type uncharacterized transport system substrate-binding protein
MAGRGGGQNFLDMLFLKGMDVAIMQQDVVSYFKKKDPKLFENSQKNVRYITKLGNLEMQIFARPEIKRLADLQGKNVSFYQPLSSINILFETVLSTCNINTNKLYQDQDIIASEFRSGNLVAFARLGVPNKAFDSFAAADGHFLPLDQNSLPAGCYEKLMNIYLPAVIKYDSYPKIMDKNDVIPTIASSTILVVYAWPEGSERYQKLATFTRKFFDNIDKFRDGPRHPKWKELNLAADVPAWTRFKPAQEWLDAKRRASR